MSRKIKLLWNFSGPESEGTAKHHEFHIREFLEKHNFNHLTTGAEQSGVFWSTYLIVDEKDMILFRDALRPHKGVIIEE